MAVIRSTFTFIFNNRMVLKVMISLLNECRGCARYQFIYNSYFLAPYSHFNIVLLMICFLLSFKRLKLFFKKKSNSLIIKCNPNLFSVLRCIAYFMIFLLRLLTSKPHHFFVCLLILDEVSLRPSQMLIRRFKTFFEK